MTLGGFIAQVQGMNNFGSGSYSLSGDLIPRNYLIICRKSILQTDCLGAKHQDLGFWKIGEGNFV